MGRRARRPLHLERFVRAFGVEFGDEVIEPRLLLQTIHARWTGGFFLQRQMHALVAAVPLRMRRLDAP